MPTTNRPDLKARSERLLARSALLDTQDLDWDSVGEVEVESPVISCLIYMRDVEAFTNRYLTGLVAHPATVNDPLIARFLPIWQAEEAEHAHALDRYLQIYASRVNIAMPAIQPAPPVNTSERWLVAATRPIGHVVTAAHMTWGCANELLTMTGYRLLANRTADPVLTDLLLRIAKQEARHYSFYRLQAEWRLQNSRLARCVVTKLMRTSWTPVGVGDGFKTPSEFDQVLTFLLGDSRGKRAVGAMDNTFTTLPGLENLRIYQYAVTASLASR